LTTPEQLALLCAWEGARLYFENLACVILDEIHTLHASKRGDLLALDLARLQQFAPNLRRVGLSATVDDPEVIKAWMANHSKGGNLTVDLVRGPPGAAPIVEVLLSEGRVPWAGHTAQHAMAEVYEVIKKSKTALVFVNTRFQAEFAFQELWRLNEDALPIALHHGSLAAEQRRKVEAAMARGELRAVVCTSTLDLGIDWGDVDLVIQLASPKGASRMVQRIGRANHRMDEPSRAIFVPANRFEMLECQAAREAIAENKLDGDPPRVGALDVLAQHVMGCACSEPFDLLALYDEIRSSGPYRDLIWEDFEQVVDFVSTGGYALKNYDKFRRIVKGPDGLWRVRNAETALRHRLNVGAIVSPAVLSVRIALRGGRGGRKIGEVEEGMLEMLEPGETFVFAGQVWRLVGVTNLDVLVQPAPLCDPRRGRDAAGDLPAWEAAFHGGLSVRGTAGAYHAGHAADAAAGAGGRGAAGVRVQRLCNGDLGAEPDGPPRLRRTLRRGHAGRRPGSLACRELHDEARLQGVRDRLRADRAALSRAREIRATGDLLNGPHLRRAAAPSARPPAAALRAGRCGHRVDRRGPAGRHAGANQGQDPACASRTSFAVLGLGYAGNRQGALAGPGGRDDPARGRRRPDRRGHAVNSIAARPFAYQFAPSPCGGLRTRLMAAEVMLRASGALWLEAERTLVVADLHLEKGSSYAARGQMLPPYDTRETLRRLAAEVAALIPAVIVLLGDTFHDRRSEARLAADDAQSLRELATGRTLIWVIGNHDADGPQALPGSPPRGAPCAAVASSRMPSAPSCRPSAPMPAA